MQKIEDVAGLVERLSSFLAGSNGARRTLNEAIETLQAQAAEIERRDEAIASQNKVIQEQALSYLALDGQAQELMDRAEAAEAKLREAVEMISSAPVRPDCDWKCKECDCGIRAWDDRRSAWLATMEKR